MVDAPLVPLGDDDIPGDLAEILALYANVVPGVGGALASIFGGWATQRKVNRVREVLFGVAKEVERLRTKVSQEYVRTEDFEDLLEETLRQVGRERNEAKRRIYRDFIVSLITEPADTYDGQLQVLRVIEQLTEEDLRLLRAIDQQPSEQPPSYMAATPLQVLATRLVGTTPDQIQVAISRLQGLRLVGAFKWSDLRAARHAEDLRQTLTPLGRRVLDVMRSR